MKKASTAGKKYYLWYTALFFLLFFLCFGIYFWRYGKSFIWQVDGMEQQYTTFLYIGEWLRDLFHGRFRMWDISIGYGSDALITFGTSYMDPFNWIAVFFTGPVTEYAFDFSIILRFYIAGLAFSHYCRYRKLDDLSTLVGACIYTFSAGMFIAFTQPSFLNPFTLFPWLMLGVEKIWNKEKPYFYTFIYAMCTINSYYFTYMMSIMVFVYCLSRFFLGKGHEKTVSGFFRMVGIFIFWSVLGFIAGIGFTVPNIINLMGTGRMKVERAISLFTSESDTHLITEAMLLSWRTRSDSYIGFSAFVFVCLFFALYHWKENILPAFLLCITTVSLYMPVVCSAMNGFQYPAWRWVFAWHMLVSFMVAKNMKNVFRDGKKKLIVVLCCSAAFAVLEYFMAYHKGKVLYASLALLVVTPLILFGIRKMKKPIRAVVVVLLMTASLMLPANFSMSYSGMYLMGEEVDMGTAYNKLLTSGGKLLVKDKPDIYRYETNNTFRLRNSSSLIGRSGIDLYFGYYNQDVDKFHSDLAMHTAPWNFDYSSLNARSSLDHLFGVRYYLIPESLRCAKPYGYSYLAGHEDNYVLQEKLDLQKKYPDAAAPYPTPVIEMFESDYPDSLMCAFTEAADLEQFYSLKPYDREKLLMDRIVLEKEKTSALPEFGTDEIGFTADRFKDMEYADGMFKVTKGGGGVVFKLDREVTDCEIYLYLGQLNNQDNIYDKYSFTAAAMKDGKIVDAMTSFTECTTVTSHMYGGKHNWLLNLGHSEKTVNEFKIQFGQRGVYTADDIRLYIKKKDAVIREAEGLVRPDRNIELGTNSLTADLEMEQDGYVLLTIPYSSGWTAYLDGEKIELLKADVAFTGFRCAKGEHHLEMKYVTPYLGTGLIISGIAFAGMLGAAVLDRLQEKRRTQE